MVNASTNMRCPIALHSPLITLIEISEKGFSKDKYCMERKEEWTEVVKSIYTFQHKYDLLQIRLPEA